ncbi:MAG: alpha/beta hydrolase [Desulfatitalea sp.]|nr:alpha/beta hydrolase [Desulfatitalea sp.]
MAAQDTELQHGYVDLKDVRLHYASRGQGRLMLFLHGFPEFWAAWEAQLSFFGAHFQAVAPDLRGYNLSSKPPAIEQYHIKALTADIAGLADQLGHRTMVLVAHDWGGGVAWAFANRYPDRVEKLIIINSPHPAIFARELLQNPEQRQASGYMNQLREPDAERDLSADHYAFLMQALEAGGSRWQMDDGLRRRYIEAWSQPGALTGGLNYYRVSPLHPAASPEEENVLRQIARAPRDLFAVKVPTLVIWGEEDHALLTGNLEGLEAYVDQLTIRRIPDGTHWVVHEQPDRVNALIAAFVGDIGQTGD